ncbi:hypothetical protein KY289_029825 [Solanum tuberosum]|nr:hypothetical protein KY289_029825 [Solanum tuberosum]
MKFLRYVYVSEINGCVEHERLKGLDTRIQFMADNVGHICFSFWVCGNEEETDSAKETDAKEDEEETDAKEDEKETDSEETFYEETFYEEDEKETDSEETDSEEDEEEMDSEETDSKEDENDISRKPRYLLFLVVLVELEMQKIILGELKTSKFAQSRTFKDKILPKGFSYHLCNLLEYLRNEKLKKLPTNVTARNIDVAIEFLLVFLGDVPNHVINGKGLNEVLANIGVLVGDILCVIQMLLAESTIKEDSSKIDLDTMQILVKIEDLKAQVEEMYKSLKYSPSNYEFPAVGGLNFLDSLLRKLNEMLKSESSLDFLMKPHIGILE